MLFVKHSPTEFTEMVIFVTTRQEVYYAETPDNNLTQKQYIRAQRDITHCPTYIFVRKHNKSVIAVQPQTSTLSLYIYTYTGCSNREGDITYSICISRLYSYEMYFKYINVSNRSENTDEWGALLLFQSSFIFYYNLLYNLNLPVKLITNFVQQ